MTKIEIEKKTLTRMIQIYCKGNHGSKNGLCNECLDLQEYAHGRLDSCRYADKKPSCVDCTTHCYKPEYREKIRVLMRYSGPRMMFYYPIDFLKHIFRRFKT